MLIRVLIVDDMASIRRLEKRLLANENEIEVVGEAADAPEAIRSAGELKPDVIVMDLNMPGDGFTATRDVKERRPQVRVLAITTDPELFGPDAVKELGTDVLLPKTEIGSLFRPLSGSQGLQHDSEQQERWKTSRQTRELDFVAATVRTLMDDRREHTPASLLGA